MIKHCLSVQFSCSVVSNSATPWSAAHQASLSIANSQSLLKLMSMESVTPSNHLILCASGNTELKSFQTHIFICMQLYACLLSHFSRAGLSATLWLPTRLSCPWDSQGKNTGVGCHTLLQGIFLTQGQNTHFFLSPALVGGFFTTSATWFSPIRSGL